MAEKTAKDEFLEIYRKYIKRAGSKELLDWLLTTDYFTAPASTKFHNAFEGGLVVHSLNVYKRFKSMIELEYGKDYAKVFSDESIAICGLLHDICKVGTYTVEMRNVKENGNWVQKPYYAVEDTMPYGHGEKSVYIISGFMKLSREEAMIINWHMGGFDQRVRQTSATIADAFSIYPRAAIFSCCDLLASYIDEERPK